MMQDHRNLAPGSLPVFVDISKNVREHSTKHPGSVKRSVKAQARAAGKRAKASRKGNR